MMRKSFVLILVLLATVTIDCVVAGYIGSRSKPHEMGMSENHVYYQKIHPRGRSIFIRSQLDKGLKEMHAIATGEEWPHFEDIDEIQAQYGIPPANFSINLVEWVRRDFQLNYHEIDHLVKYSMVCFPEGCYDPNDVGAACCPF